MSEHTPGPWEWWTSNSWRRLRHSDRGVSTNVIMPVVCPDGHPDLEVNAADAALIAAAPNMLATLRTVAAQFTTIDNICNEEAVAAVLAAIAKAEGRA